MVEWDKVLYCIYKMAIESRLGDIKGVLMIKNILKEAKWKQY